LSLMDITKGYDPERVVTNHVPVDKNNQFTIDGVFSEKIFGKNDTTGQSFTCLCGKIQGRFHSGEMCADCNTRVKQRSSDISKKGWINLEPFFIINPFFWKQLQKLVGRSLDAIAQYEPKLNLNGNVDKANKSKIAYANIGMVEFKEKFDEVIEYYLELNKKKESARAAYLCIVEHHDKVWIDKFPVYSSILRPAVVIQKMFTFSEENTFFNQMINNINLLKNKVSLEKSKLSELPLIYECQCAANRIYDKINTILAGKTGFLRNTLLGNRINFSVRTVISPLPPGAYSINDIEFPYLAAVELFKYEILRVLAISTGSYLEASRVWFESTLEFNEKVFNILNELREKTKGGLTVLLDRNPTIELGSMLYCNIVKFKKDYNDFTLGVSNQILALIAGDFDGLE
jgi:DNA-directed RNA polymerase beta' subunit